MPKPKKRGSNHQRGAGERGRGGGAPERAGGARSSPDEPPGRAGRPWPTREAAGRPGRLLPGALLGLSEEAAGRTGAAAELPAGREGAAAGPGPGPGPGGAAAGLTGAGPETATSRPLRACARRRGRPRGGGGRAWRRRRRAAPWGQPLAPGQRGEPGRGGGGRAQRREWRWGASPTRRAAAVPAWALPGAGGTTRGRLLLSVRWLVWLYVGVLCSERLQCL